MDPEKLSEKTDPGYELQYIDISSVSLEVGIKEKQLLTFEESPSRARKKIASGDTIISTVRTYLKAIAFIENAEENWIASTGFCVLRPDTRKVAPKFLYRAIQSKPFIDAVVACSDGVSYPAINPSVLGRIEIPIPELDEQIRIVDYLDREIGKLDAIVEKLGGYLSASQSEPGSFLATLIEKRTALISDAVSGVEEVAVHAAPNPSDIKVREAHG